MNQIPLLSTSSATTPVNESRERFNLLCSFKYYLSPMFSLWKVLSFLFEWRKSRLAMFSFIFSKKIKIERTHIMAGLSPSAGIRPFLSNITHYLYCTLNLMNDLRWVSTKFFIISFLIFQWKHLHAYLFQIICANFFLRKAIYKIGLHPTGNWGANDPISCTRSHEALKFLILKYKLDIEICEIVLNSWILKIDFWSLTVSLQKVLNSTDPPPQYVL